MAGDGRDENGTAPDDGLRSEHRRAIAALLVGADDTAAGQAAGVSGRTVRRWRSQPAFAAALADAERAVIADAVRLLSRLSVTAVRQTGAILTSKKSSDSAKLRAAGLILQSVIALRSHHELEEAMRRIEAQIAGDEA